MKIALFSPYLSNNFGGGEKYLLDCALALARQKHQVFMAVSSEQSLSTAQLQEIKQDYAQFMGTSLEPITFTATPLSSTAGFLKKYVWTKKFDVMFYLTDGSLFFSGADKNILHIQVPLKLNKSGLIERLKLRNWQTKITNSTFTKEVIEDSWETEIDLVHHPMVRVNNLITKTDFKQKKKVILNVGRFFSQLHSKRQDILVKIFNRLLTEYKQEAAGWQLVLIGNVEDEAYAQKVHQLAQGLPVKILHQVSRAELLNWFRQSSIYWHATGYRVNEQKNPQKAEHFGITTVEAMAAGNVPVVVGKGGQLEVIGADFKDWTWLTQRDCLKKTRQLIKNDDLRLQLQKKAQERSGQFGPKKFVQKLKTMIEA